MSSIPSLVDVQATLIADSLNELLDRLNGPQVVGLPLTLGAFTQGAGAGGSLDQSTTFGAGTFFIEPANAAAPGPQQPVAYVGALYGWGGFDTPWDDVAPQQLFVDYYVAFIDGSIEVDRVFGTPAPAGLAQPPTQAQVDQAYEDSWGAGYVDTSKAMLVGRIQVDRTADTVATGTLDVSVRKGPLAASLQAD